MGNLLALDESIFVEDFGVRPFRIRHHLAGHPFLSLERILDLIPRFPGAAPEEAIQRIAERSSWMVIEHVESEPELGWLLDAALDDVAAHSERIAPGMHAREGFVFVGAPDAVTPCHVDPGHSFLLQVRGAKTVFLYDGRDRSVLTFVLGPGDGLYFPATHPHWVKNGPEPSISFGVTFRTAATDARERLYESASFETL